MWFPLVDMCEIRSVVWYKPCYSTSKPFPAQIIETESMRATSHTLVDLTAHTACTETLVGIGVPWHIKRNINTPRHTHTVEKLLSSCTGCPLHRHLSPGFIVAITINGATSMRPVRNMVLSSSLWLGVISHLLYTHSPYQYVTKSQLRTVTAGMWGQVNCPKTEQTQRGDILKLGGVEEVYYDKSEPLPISCDQKQP